MKTVYKHRWYGNKLFVDDGKTCWWMAIASISYACRFSTASRHPKSCRLFPLPVTDCERARRQHTCCLPSTHLVFIVSTLGFHRQHIGRWRTGWFLPCTINKALTTDDTESVYRTTAFIPFIMRAVRPLFSVVPPAALSFRKERIRASMMAKTIKEQFLGSAVNMTFQNKPKDYLHRKPWL